MDSLSKELTRSDTRFIMDCIDHFEFAANQHAFMMNLVKKMPIPDDEDQAAIISELKQHILSQEREMMRDREKRRETAIIVKAKLLMHQYSYEIDHLADVPTDVPAEPFSEKVSAVPSTSFVPKKKDEQKPDPLLARAVDFMREYRILNNYENWLELNKKKSTLQHAKNYIESCGLESHFHDYLAKVKDTGNIPDDGP